MVRHGKQGDSVLVLRLIAVQAVCLLLTAVMKHRAGRPFCGLEQDGWQRMKVLITGCEGQVGHLLVSKLREKTHLMACDRHSLDITQRQHVLNTVAKFKPDYIINAAAYTTVDKAEDEIELAFSVNRDGPAYLAEAAFLNDSTLIHISTDYVFDGNSNDCYSETMPITPLGVYGESKLAGELAVTSNCQKFFIIRTAWLFSENGNNFVRTMLSLSKTRNQLSIVGDQFGGPTYAGDLVDAIITIINAVEACEKPQWGIYHFSGAPHVSWFEFATAIFSQAQVHGVLEKMPSLSAITSSAYPARACRPANSRLDCTKIRQQFGIEPSDWQLALKNIAEYK